MRRYSFEGVVASALFIVLFVFSLTLLTQPVFGLALVPRQAGR